MIINAGIDTIYYDSGYADELAQEMLSEAGLTLIQLTRRDAS
jgi:deoxycytidylate deaminase